MRTLIAAVLGFIFGWFLQGLRTSHDQLCKTVQHAIDAVDEAADAGSVYWLDPPQKIRAEEIRILGPIARIDGLIANLEPELGPSDRLTNLRISFHEALTGGAFLTNSVTSDMDRARSVQMYGSELIVQLVVMMRQRFTVDGVIRDIARRLTSVVRSNV